MEKERKVSTLLGSRFTSRSDYPYCIYKPYQNRIGGSQERRLFPGRLFLLAVTTERDRGTMDSLLSGPFGGNRLARSPSVYRNWRYCLLSTRTPIRVHRRPSRPPFSPRLANFDRSVDGRQVVRIIVYVRAVPGCTCLRTNPDGFAGQRSSGANCCGVANRKGGTVSRSMLPVVVFR